MILTGLRANEETVVNSSTKPEIDRVDDRPSADRGGMEYVRVVGGYRLRLRFALKRRDLLPKVIEHRIGRSVPVMGPAVHLAAGDYVDPRDLLLEDGGLRGPQLRVGKIAGGQLSKRHQPVEGLIPSRNAVGANDRRRILFVMWQRTPPCFPSVGPDLCRRPRSRTIPLSVRCR